MWLVKEVRWCSSRKPDSVTPAGAGADSHSSLRPTRNATAAGAPGIAPRVSYVALHRRGLPCPRALPRGAVGSYPTLSP